MDFLRYDLRDALRALLRSRAYMAAVVVTLGVGIGVNTAIFSLADAVLLKPLPYPQPERLVRVAEWPHTGGNFTMAPAAYLAWRDQARSFTHFEARVGTVLAIARSNTVEEVSGLRVTPGYFDMLGITPSEGRAFTADDARPGAACVAVVSRRFQATRGDDPKAPLRINGTPCDVVGVLPADSVYDRVRADVYQPLAFDAAQAQNQGRTLTVLGRLRDGVAIETASSEMASIAAAFNATRGSAGRGWTTALTPLRDVLIGADVRWLARVLFAAVVAVLLVGCLNVSGLSVTRTIARRRELAIRLALGASRMRLFQHVIAESVVLAALGGTAGLLLGSWGLRAFLALAPAGTVPAEADVSLDGRALLFTAVIALATALLSGIVPAARGTSAPASEALSGTRTAGPSRSTALVHRSLLVLEVALAVILVIGATALVTSFLRLTSVDPGFHPGQVLTTRVSLPSERYRTAEQVANFYRSLLDELRRTPGVEHAAAVTSLPLGGWRFGTTFFVRGESFDAARPPSAHIQHTSDGYIETLGLSMAEGRWFTAAEAERGPRLAVVNETFARRFVTGGSAVGRQLGQPGDSAEWEIVGVVRDVKTGSLADRANATPEIYVPHPQAPAPSMFVAVRGSEVSTLAGALRTGIRAVDREVAIGTMLTMDDRLDTSVARDRFRMTLIGSSAVLALMLACLGIYAVRAQAVASRLREMGVRLAMGATPRQLLATVLRQGMQQVMTGIVLGTIASAWLASALEPWLFSTRVSEPRVLLMAAALFALAGFAASWIPARRAAKVDPLVLLRID